MDGVTILSTQNIYAIGETIICGVLASVFLVMGICVIIDSCDDIIPGLLIAAIPLFLGIVFIIAAGKFINIEPTIQYKVTIDDTVAFSDFSEKYEIISQDGLIYTVEER